MISLIIPFYNCEYTAEKTILTVKDFISEYCEPVEFIAVNDGSTDSTHDILKRFAGGSVRLVSYEKNKHQPIPPLPNLQKYHANFPYRFCASRQTYKNPQKVIENL